MQMPRPLGVGSLLDVDPEQGPVSLPLHRRNSVDNQAVHLTVDVLYGDLASREPGTCTSKDTGMKTIF
jgi:hypothetical protein